MSRRHFLFGAIPQAKSEKPASLYLSVSRKAMAAEFEILFDRHRYPNGTEAAMLALDEIERIESKLSVFRTESELYYLNTVAPFQPVQVSEELFELVRTAGALTEETEGALDITSTPLWRLWGFAKRKGCVPDPREIEMAMGSVGFHLVQMDAQTRKIRFAHEGTSLNFGCMGKGYALDRAAKILETAGVRDFIIHGGLSSVITRGEISTLGIAHPMQPMNRLASLQWKDAAVGTSGSQQQFVIHQGKRYSHIIDPRTGRPAEGRILVTVMASSGMLADALSTAFFVWEKERTEAYLAQHPDLAVFMVHAENHAPGYRCFEFGFPDGSLSRITE